MKKKCTSYSDFEKQQISQQTFKRNKMYLDLNKLQNDQRSFQMKRRKPCLIQGSPKSQLIKQKIVNTFRNSVFQLNNKLEQQTKRFRQRVSSSNIRKLQNLIQTGYQTSRISYYNPQSQQTTQNHAIRTSRQRIINPSYSTNPLGSNKIKGISLDKQVSRQYLNRYNVQKRNVIDQRSFSNFKMTKNDLSKTQDFNKLSPRNINFVNQHINDLNYYTDKAFQMFYYSTKPMKSTFRYNTHNNKEARKFYEPQRQQNVAQTVLDPEKIRNSFTQASNFKTNKIDSFYKMSGRELPHQLDQRQLSPIRNYYKDKEGRIVKQKVDYSVKKMYDDLVKKQRQQLQTKKNPSFTRDQICDKKYFTQKIKRQKRLLHSQKDKILQ